MAVKSSLSVRTDVEDLWKFELIGIIHAQISRYENQEAALNRPRLDVLMVYVVLNFLESERLYFLSDFFDALEGLSSISHNAVVIIKVY